MHKKLINFPDEMWTKIQALKTGEDFLSDTQVIHDLIRRGLHTYKRQEAALHGLAAPNGEDEEAA